MVANLRFTLALALALLSAGAGAGCGANKKEAAQARASVYDTDFAIVYSAAVASVRDLYPDFQENAATGKITTSWHQVKYSDPGADDPKSQQVADRAQGDMSTSPGATGGYGINPTVTRRTSFIRFDVTVTGGRPWRVHVRGTASQLIPGNALPTELRGADAPHWLAGRTDELVLAIHRRLKKYAMPAPVEVEAVRVDAPPTVDVNGDIPDGARKTAVAAVAAIRLREPAALRAQLADDVRWSLGAPPGADGAMAMWQADPSALAAMASAIEAGCATVDGGEVQCPAVPGRHDWRVRLGERRGGWRVIAFVDGE